MYDVRLKPISRYIPPGQSIKSNLNKTLRNVQYVFCASCVRSKTPKKAYFSGTLVESSSTEKFLGIQIDSDLTFDEHISSICNKIGKKN